MNKIYSLLASFFLLSVPVDNPLNENSNVFDHVSVVEETYNSKNGRIDTREEVTMIQL